MLFTLEAVYAKHGDALILHHGPAADPHWILVDGGPATVWSTYLRPRLDEIRGTRALSREASFPLDLVLVSHTDADHITGILDLYDDELSAIDRRAPMPFAVKQLWHNSFEDLSGPDHDEIAGVLTDTRPAPPEAAVLASAGQGLALRRAHDRLATGRFNGRDNDLVVAGYVAHDLAHGLTVRVLCPSQERIDAYRVAWRRELAALRARQKTAAQVAGMEDCAPSNLASIVVLAEMGNRRMLLTGHARGDDILTGLEAALPRAPGVTRFEVDLLKLPHHGSSRNVDEDFFRQVVADHYVISADGRDSNPDVETLRMLASARSGDDYTLHFTFPEDAVERETNEIRRARLAEVREWVRTERPHSCHVDFGGPAGTGPYVHVDLGDEPLWPSGSPPATKDLTTGGRATPSGPGSSSGRATPATVAGAGAAAPAETPPK